MSKKLMLLAAGALTALAFAALPAVASAGEWKMDCPENKETCSFSSSGGHAELRALNEPTITCTANTGGGTIAKGGLTGTFEITFTGCKATLFFTFECHTSGATSGVIKVASSTSHNVYLEDNKTKPGILVTPATTTIICGSFSSIEVTGSVIGEVTGTCNQKANSFPVDFAADPKNANTQKWETITNTGPTTYDLNAATESDHVHHTAVQVATGTIKFAGAGEGQITCL
jgi:hypothetical protein